MTGLRVISILIPPTQVKFVDTQDLYGIVVTVDLDAGAWLPVKLALALVLLVV